MSPTPLSVAIQGELGSFSHEAALGALGDGIDVLPQPTFEALFQAVVSGMAARGVVPIENSLAGSVHENYDRMESSPVHIVGETQVRVRLCLIGAPGASLASIRRVASHPVALAQCRRYFAEHPALEPMAAYDTAGSVRDLLRSPSDGHAAIGSVLAARLYGAQVLAEQLEDDPANYTRFLVIAREPAPLEPASKTSIVLTLDNVPGILYRALGAFARRGLDLSKIESRPLVGRPWEYAFYLDVLGDPRGAVAEAVAECRTLARELRVLGSYAQAPSPPYGGDP